MEFNILFTVLNLISILLKPLSYTIYAETPPCVISYVSTGFGFLLCFAFVFVCMKLQVQICNDYLRVGVLQKCNEDGEPVCVLLKPSFFSKSEGLVSPGSLPLVGKELLQG